MKLYLYLFNKKNQLINIQIIIIINYISIIKSIIGQGFNNIEI